MTTVVWCAAGVPPPDVSTTAATVAAAAIAVSPLASHFRLRRGRTSATNFRQRYPRIVLSSASSGPSGRSEAYSVISST